MKKRNTILPKGTKKKFGDKTYYYAGRTIYPSKPSYPDLSEQFSKSYWNPKRRNPSKGEITSNIPVVPTLIGSFLGFWIGGKVKPETSTSPGGGAIGAIIGAVGGFLIGRKIPVAKINNPRSHKLRNPRDLYLRSSGDRGWHYGDRVQVRPEGGMSEFRNVKGTVIGAEGEYLRIKFDSPVNVRSVGLVKDDLFMPHTIRKIRS